MLQSSPTCFGWSGQSISGTDELFQVCNTSATGQAGSHSACCSGSFQDACLSSGLCLATWSIEPISLLFINGCTDQTWSDPACPGIYRSSQAWQDTAVAPYLVPCGTGSWACCNQNLNAATCCQQNFTLNAAIGTVVRQLSASTATGSTSGTVSGSGPATQASCPSNTGTASSSSIDATAAAAIGGALGALLVGCVVAVVFLALSNRKLRKTRQSGGGTGSAQANFAGGKSMDVSPAEGRSAQGPQAHAADMGIFVTKSELPGSWQMGR